MSGQVTVTWLGHAAFRVVSPGGRVILFDPWLDNPKCPPQWKSLDRVDLILPTHGHFDHLGNTVDLAKKHNAKVVAIYEISVWLESKGVTTVIGANKGGTVDVDGLRVTMVPADHSSGIAEGGQVVYGGDPVGFVVQLENGFRIYHAGDTNVFGDMRLIGRLYRPDLALLPIGGHFTMGPLEAAEAIRLLGVSRVIPMHYGTFPILAGTPDQLREFTRDVPGLQIYALQPGESVTF